MNVCVKMTQNDNERAFEVSVPISSREVTYEDPQSALISPLAHKLFGFPWAEKVTITPTTVVVTKQDWVDWSILEEPLLGLITEHLKSSPDSPLEENPEPVVSKAPDAYDDLPEMTSEIKKLFETSVNPALAQHGGFVELLGIRDNQAFIKMGGGCQGCQQSYNTVKNGIQSSVLAAIPTLAGVVDVTEHDLGTQPYY